MSIPLYVIAVLALLGGSAFFSAAEMAISSANRMRLASAAEEGSRGAKTALAVLDRFQDALSAILIGNNLCNIASDSLATVLVMALLGSRYNGLASVLTTVVMTLIVIVFCESAPKIAAKKNANRLALGISGIIRACMILLAPVVLLVKGLIWVLTLPLKGEHLEDSAEEAAAELQSIIETVEDEGVIDEERSELLLSALDFSQIPVMDVMTARVDVEALDVDSDWKELLLSGEDDSFSRLPVYEDSIDNIIGILHLNRFYRALLDDPDADVRGCLMKPLYIYKTVKLPDVLNQLRRSQQHLAVVTDEYGGTLGIVTLEDVLEQIVGDIWDDSDEVEEDVVARPDGAFEVDGDLPIGELAELLDMPEEDLSTDSATAGGWTIEKFGAFPKAGDSLDADGLLVRVLAMDEDGLRVEKILVEKKAKEP
ncbi:MAG: HlyC/CorC family transporter [Oscillospiraceae bacterium]|nr:HlyC/CorC family transporter [Oscillospiraceae bacterium]